MDTPQSTKITMECDANGDKNVSGFPSVKDYEYVRDLDQKSKAAIPFRPILQLSLLSTLIQTVYWICTGRLLSPARMFLHGDD